MSGVSAVLGEEHNFLNVPEAIPPQKPPQKPKQAPVSKRPEVPVVLPAAEEIGRIRARSNSMEERAGELKAEWRGVSAMNSLEHNVADLSVSPAPPRPSNELVEPKPSAPAPIPVVLPSANIMKSKATQKEPSQLKPLTNWGGVSTIVADEYNMPDQPETMPPVPAPAASHTIDATAAPSVEDKTLEALGHHALDFALEASNTRRARRPSADVVLASQPSYGGVSSDLGSDYNTPPSPKPPPRRSRQASKEIAMEEVKPPQAYPVEADEPAFDEYSYDIAALKAKAALDNGPRAVHHGYSPLSSIIA